MCNYISIHTHLWFITRREPTKSNNWSREAISGTLIHMSWIACFCFCKPYNPKITFLSVSSGDDENNLCCCCCRDRCYTFRNKSTLIVYPYWRHVHSRKELNPTTKMNISYSFNYISLFLMDHILPFNISFQNIGK